MDSARAANDSSGEQRARRRAKAGGRITPPPPVWTPERRSPIRGNGTAPAKTSTPSPSREGPDGADRATALSSVLDQMEKFFRADTSERNSRLRALEERQQELQRLMQLAAEQQQQEQQQEQQKQEHQHRHHDAHKTRDDAADPRTAATSGTAAAGAPGSSGVLAPASTPGRGGGADLHREVRSLTERCNESMHDLVDESRAAIEDAAKVREVNERLVAQLEAKERQVAALSSKMEQLARNVVKAIRERNHFEDRLVEREQQLAKEEQTVLALQGETRERHGLDSENAQLKAQLLAATKENAIAHEESAKLAAALEHAVGEGRQLRRELQEERDTVVAQLTEQLCDTVVERDEANASLAQAQSTCERLADELQSAIEHMRLLDEKLAASDRALTSERAVRAALERDLTALKSAHGIAPYGPHSHAEGAEGGGLSMAASVSIREEVRRLQGMLDGAVLENADNARRAEARVAALTQLNTQLSARCRDYEATIAELRTEVAHVGRERTHATLAGQRLRALIQGIQHDAAATSGVIMTTRSDAEAAVANAQDEPSLRFAQQALSDFANIAHFFGSLRRLDVSTAVAHLASADAAAPTQPQTRSRSPRGATRDIAAVAAADVGDHNGGGGDAFTHELRGQQRGQQRAYQQQQQQRRPRLSPPTPGGSGSGSDSNNLGNGNTNTMQHHHNMDSQAMGLAYPQVMAPDAPPWRGASAIVSPAP